MIQYRRSWGELSRIRGTSTVESCDACTDPLFVCWCRVRCCQSASIKDISFASRDPNRQLSSIRDLFHILSRLRQRFLSFDSLYLTCCYSSLDCCPHLLLCLTAWWVFLRCSKPPPWSQDFREDPCLWLRLVTPKGYLRNAQQDA